MAASSIGVTDLGTYFNWTVALGADDGPGSVRGLLGSNSGWESDMQLSNGTVLWEAAPAAILGEYADSWRVQPGASLLDDFISARLARTIGFADPVGAGTQCMGAGLSKSPRGGGGRSPSQNQSN